MNLYEAIKNNANSRLIIKPVPSNDVWLKFKLGDVTGSAKVFIEGSDYGIHGFDKISKLSYSSSNDECNYDRGWDVKPKDEELFNKICKGLEDYRNKHPYSLDESVYVPTPEEAIEFGNSLERVDTTRKPIIAPGLVTETIERRQYSDDSWYQFEDLHREEIGEFYRREGTHHVDPLEDGDIYEEFKDFLIDYYTKNPKEIPWMSHPINEADDSYSLNTSIKDWYKTEFPEDDYGEYLKDGITFKQLYDALGTTEDIYEVMFNGDYGDSIVRERLFGELSDLMNVDYDVIYYKWLYGTEDGKSPNLTEADDNSTEIIKGVIKSKNLPNGTKVSSITDDTFNSIVKDVQSKIPGSKENDVRNKVAGTLYSMFEESAIEDDEYIDCEWCGDHVPLDECKKELNLGWICRGCQNALYSRGEHPVYDEQADYHSLDDSENKSTYPSDFIPNYAGLRCPKCNSNLYYEIDDEEYDDGTQKFHYECKDCGYVSGQDEFNHNDFDEAEGTGAKILDFEETGGGCLDYVGEVGDYNFVGELNGDLMFIPKSCGINSWEAYQDLHEEHFADWESHDELIPDVATALEKYAKTIKNPRYRVAVYDDVSRLRYPDESLDEAEGSEDATEKYWDATTLKQDAFLRLMKFNFDEPHGCQYIITNDANELERFKADSDEEAIGFYDSFKEGIDSGLIELIPADLDVKPIVPREDINETELSDRKFCDLPDDFQKKVITYLLKQKRGNSKEIIEYLMNAKVGDFNDTSLLTQDEFVDLYDV